MNLIWDGIEKRKTLRTEAETMLSSLAPEELTSRPDEVLMHELLVHKVELEMQNEELRSAHIAMEEARDRYVDLYEFAPVGFITISREALISEINLTGCAMLGVDRNKLISRRFSNHVATQDRDHWQRLFMNMMEHTEGEKQAFELQLIRADGSVLFAHLDCLRWDVVDTPPVLRIALSDISKLKLAEAELRIAATAFESQESMLVTDADTVILRVNQAFTNDTGYTNQEAAGQTPRLLNSGRHKADFYAAMWESINRTGGWEGEIWNKRKNGEIYPGRLHITTVRNDSGQVTNYIGAFKGLKQSQDMPGPIA
jgi:PAS domain S-box-containing protein